MTDCRYCGGGTAAAAQANEQHKSKERKTESTSHTNTHTHSGKNFPLVWTHVVSRERLNFYLGGRLSVSQHETLEHSTKFAMFACLLLFYLYFSSSERVLPFLLTLPLSHTMQTRSLCFCANSLLLKLRVHCSRFFLSVCVALRCSNLFS